MSIESALVHKYEEKEEAYFQSDRDEMLSYVPKEARVVLDIGCGYGNFAQLLKLNRAATVWGVELDKQAADAALLKLDHVVNAPFSRALCLPKKHFDCIIFNDVLEHLTDTDSALIYCKELLKSEGSIVASIPNVRYFDNIWNLLMYKNWEYTDWGILDRTHLRFFTYKSILSTFEMLGYDVKLIEGINPLEKFHPHHLKKFKPLNWLLMNNIQDMRYLQFAVVAQHRSV